MARCCVVQCRGAGRGGGQRVSAWVLMGPPANHMEWYHVSMWCREMCLQLVRGFRCRRAAGGGEQQACTSTRPWTKRECVAATMERGSAAAVELMVMCGESCWTQAEWHSNRGR
jgi:hypothetical protein